MILAVQNMTIATGKPKSLGLKIGHAVRKCCEIARCMAIKTGNESLKCEAENFAILMDGEYSDMVTSSLLREMYDAKLNRDFALPVTSELVKLSRGNSLESAMREMKDFPSEDK